MSRRSEAKEQAASSWAPLREGRISAAGAPRRARLVEWANKGVTDVVTLQRADEHALWLPEAVAPSRSVMVHCAAGLHRTGVFMYLLMRTAGLSRDEAVERIRVARPLTAKELCRTGKRGSLEAIAESWFEATR